METKEFTPKQWVLARDNGEWFLARYSHYSANYNRNVIVGGSFVRKCIPYEGNEYLLGTTDPYVEPYVPKDGEFVAMPCGKELTYIAIYEGIWNGMVKGYTITDNKDVKIKDANMCPFEFFLEDSVDCIRQATEEEKQLLLSKLHKIDRDWDEEKKEIVDWKWEPHEGEDVYYPLFSCGEFISSKATWFDNDIDVINLKCKGYIFHTEEEATSLCDKLNEAIKNVK